MLAEREETAPHITEYSNDISEVLLPSLKHLTSVTM